MEASALIIASLVFLGALAYAAIGGCVAALFIKYDEHTREDDFGIIATLWPTVLVLGSLYYASTYPYRLITRPPKAKDRELVEAEQEVEAICAPHGNCITANEFVMREHAKELLIREHQR